jgi:hypothetical protein
MVYKAIYPVPPQENVDPGVEESQGVLQLDPGLLDVLATMVARLLSIEVPQ